MVEIYGIQYLFSSQKSQIS